MWCISYKAMSLQDVLIMAYMNVVQATRQEGFLVMLLLRVCKILPTKS